MYMMLEIPRRRDGSVAFAFFRSSPRRLGKYICLACGLRKQHSPCRRQTIKVLVDVNIVFDIPRLRNDRIFTRFGGPSRGRLRNGDGRLLPEAEKARLGVIYATIFAFIRTTFSELTSFYHSSPRGRKSVQTFIHVNTMLEVPRIRNA